MIWDGLIYSRTKEVDYCWLVKPDYVDDKIELLKDKMFSLRNNGDTADYSQQQWRHNMIYLRSDSFCGIFRTIEGSEQDHVGRPICSFEGIACPIADEPLFRADLPNIVLHWLSSAECLLGTAMKGAGACARVEIPDVINPFTIGDELEQYMQKLDEAEADPLTALCHNIALCKEIPSFVFGQESRIYMHVAGKHCGVTDVYSQEKCRDPRQTGLKIERFDPELVPEPREMTKVAVVCSIRRAKRDKDGYSYRWIVLPEGDRDEAHALYSTMEYSFTDEIGLERLRAEAAAVGGYLQYLGWEADAADGTDADISIFTR